MSIRMNPGMSRLTVLGKGWNDNTVIDSGDGFIVDEEIWDGGDVPPIPEGDGVFRFTVHTGTAAGGYQIWFRFLGRITVDWGDGNVDGPDDAIADSINSYHFAFHWYPETNTEYTVSITGDLQHFSFSSAFRPVGYPERGCLSVTAVLTPFPATMCDVVDFRGLFLGCQCLARIPADLFCNCPNVTDFSLIFSECYSLRSIPAGLFDNCKNVTDFSYAFFKCWNLASIPTGLFDNCPNVTDFVQVFYDCREITSALPALWETHAGANGYGCFYKCYNAANYESVPDDWR